jgi:23S rRNA (pseudouridine1915-N3)-methyltransferase
MRLIAVGRLRAGPEAELFARYNARLRPAMHVTEVPEHAGSPMEAKRREGAALLAALPAGAHGLAVLLGRWRDTGRIPCFLIGGAEGLDATVLARADLALALGRLTWPHMLVRVLLAEQLFRAQSILANHPYHRAGRP